MFVALRDLRHARGRFALVLTVVALIALLVSFVSALTAGLARESASAISDLPADHVTFGATGGQSPQFTASTVQQHQWQALATTAGVRSAQPIGIATTRATGAEAASVTVFGVQPGSGLLPPASPDVAPGRMVLTPAAATALGVGAGDAVTASGSTFTVAGIASVDRSYSHTPLVWTTLADWQRIGAPAGTGGTVATVVALSTTGAADLAAADATAGTTTVTRDGARSAIGAFAGENTSLTTMQGFLLVISALVVGAFFTVWTISRSGDVAVLKALGASTRYLLRDALGQALLVLVAGVGLGTGVAAAAGLALSTVMPVEVSAATTLLPAAALLLLGLAGAAASVARVTQVDPHAALAAR